MFGNGYRVAHWLDGIGIVIVINSMIDGLLCCRLVVGLLDYCWVDWLGAWLVGWLVG